MSAALDASAKGEVGEMCEAAAYAVLGNAACMVVATLAGGQLVLAIMCADVDFSGPEECVSKE